MKKKIGLLLALVFALTCALTACKPADTVVDPEVDDPPETLEENAEPANPWAEILTQNGFVSNDADQLLRRLYGGDLLRYVR